MGKIVALLLLATIAASSCTKDSDCPQYQVCSQKSCVRKNLFPLQNMEILGTVLVFTCSALSNAAGQGGGPLMTLILLVLFQFETAVALPMVQIIILGGSTIGFILRTPMRHPTRNRPLIDYYIFTLVASPLLVGTTIGVILNLIFPAWLILALLTLVLIYITYTSASMSIKIYKKENAEKTKISEDTLLTDDDKPTIVDEASIEITPELKKIINSEKRYFPIVPAVIFLSMYSFSILSTLLKGSSTFNSIAGIPQCSPGFWVLTVAIFVIYIIFTLLVAFYMLYVSRKKVSLGYNFDSYDIIWSWAPMSICMIVGVLAGIGAGLLSFGGALILGPIMLKLGVRPEVSAGTSTAIIILTSSISVFQYGVAGKLDFTYGAWLFFMSFIGSSIGVTVVKLIVAKLKRGSIMVMILTILMGLCAVLTPVYGIVNLTSSSNIALGFKSYC
jgi:uncharacterized membrane protein YfcA